MSAGLRGSWLAANLALLARGQPGLAALVGTSPPEPYELVASRSGEPSARRGGKLLHSAYDPRGEARRLIAAAVPPGADTAVVLGTGLGYAVEEALAVGGVEHVLVCEADCSRFAAFLDARDLSALLADARLSWIVGGEPGAVLAAFEDFGTRRAGLVGQRSLEAEAEAWYAALRQAVERFRSKEEINENTLKRFGRLWVRNLARNAGHLAGLPGIKGLEGLFEGLPALVLAAGPSLDEVLPRLAELRERCVLVAVDTALRSLLAAGVEPDFLVVVDPQYWNWRHLADLDFSGALLVSEPAVFPPVLRKPRRAAFLASSLFPLGRALDPEERGLLGAGGSVATSAWDFARQLGAAPLYMSGLDLGYPEGQTHARASLFEQRSLAAGTRLKPASAAQAGALFGAPTRLVPANDGGSVASDQRMILYAWWFESRLAKAGSPRTLTLSQRGCAIPGLPLAGLDELLALPPRRALIDGLLERAAAERISAGSRAAAARAFEALLKGLSTVADLAETGRAAASRAAAQLAAGKDAAASLGDLDRVDAGLRGNETKDVAGFLLPPLTELLGSRPRDLAESLEASEALYRRIGNAARENLDLLARYSTIDPS